MRDKSLNICLFTCLEKIILLDSVEKKTKQQFQNMKSVEKYYSQVLMCLQFIWYKNEKVFKASNFFLTNIIISLIHWYTFNIKIYSISFW